MEVNWGVAYNSKVEILGIFAIRGGKTGKAAWEGDNAGVEATVR